MSRPFVPIKTVDLTWEGGLPYSIEYGDRYNSENGLEQCRSVFIDGNNLIARFSELSNDSSSLFNIAEIGFGTGLNFLTTWSAWEKHAPKLAQLHYISCEKNPLSLTDLSRSLTNWPELAAIAEELISTYPILTPGFHHLSFAEGRVQLTLMLGDAFDCYEQLVICNEVKLEAQLRDAFIDAWFLDGVVPSEKDGMWRDDLFQVIAMLSKSKTTLATYMATASVQLALVQAGFHVETKEGAGPDRGLICASFIQSKQGLKQRHTPWHVPLPRPHQLKEAVIIGAGLAGCFTAHSLAKRGWKVSLIEEQTRVGTGASANQQAVLFPKLSAHVSPLSQLMLQSFLYATRVYQTILKQHPIGALEGALLLAHNKQESKAQQGLAQWLSNYPELAVLVDEESASNLAGLPIDKTGLFIPGSGWIDSPALCDILIDSERINLIPNSVVHSLEFHKNAWQVLGLETPVLILANGHKLTHFKQTEELPIRSIRGQMTSIQFTSQSLSLKIPLCGEGHVLPQVNGCHSLGATYDFESNDLSLSKNDDQLNYSHLDKLTHQVNWSKDVVSSWAGVRAGSPDYLPLVGPVADKDAFECVFSGLSRDSNLWIAQPGPYYPGLYACAGFGSRGLTTIPLCAEWLAGSINKELGFLPRHLIQSLSPARFMRRNIIRGGTK